ncbi:MAG: type VI secretion system tube protein Hcp [Proteobacteria bacterium]|nr:type VI secretion system tube protein Hcp [Pseudomonadota bacterium]
MADTESSDLLMLFKPQGKLALEGEGMSTFDPNDSLMTNFLPNRFCEVEDFNFGAGIEDTDSSGAEEGADTEGALDNELHSHDPKGRPKNGKGGKGKQKVRKFKRFVEQGAPAPGQGTLGYDVNLDEVTVNRQMDRMSMVLLQLCLNQTPLDLIVLVKRKFTGNQSFHEAYLRLEFTQPLITSVEWEHGEVMKEKLKFVCRGIKASYKPQASSGTLGNAIPANFKYDAITN